MTLLVVVPASPGLPSWWWMGWITIAAALYIFMGWWIFRHALREDRAAAQHVEGTSAGEAEAEELTHGEVHPRS